MGILNDHPALALGLIGAFLAMVLPAPRARIGAQWISQMMIGGFFSATGFHYLGILVWVLGTCQCLAILMIGRRLEEPTRLERGGIIGAGLVIGAALFAAFTTTSAFNEHPTEFSLAELGSRWGEEGGLALVLMGFAWVIAILGLGVISIRTGSSGSSNTGGGKSG